MLEGWGEAVIGAGSGSDRVQGRERDEGRRGERAAGAGGARAGGGRAAREWAAAERGCAPTAPPPVRTPAAPLPHGRPHSAEQQCSKTRRDSDQVRAARSAMLEDRTARVAVGERS